MECFKKQEIKKRIKKIIECNPKMPMVLEVGFIGSKLCFLSKRVFETRILDQIEHNNVYDIVFKGEENMTLSFKTIYQVEDTWCDSKGYGQGKQMGD